MSGEGVAVFTCPFIILPGFVSRSISRVSHIFLKMSGFKTYSDINNIYSTNTPGTTSKTGGEIL